MRGPPLSESSSFFGFMEAFYKAFSELFFVGTKNLEIFGPPMLACCFPPYVRVLFLYPTCFHLLLVSTGRSRLSMVPSRSTPTSDPDFPFSWIPDPRVGYRQPTFLVHLSTYLLFLPFTDSAQQQATLNSVATTHARCYRSAGVSSHFFFSAF